MAEITIKDLMCERGELCEACGLQQMQHRHHCLIHDMKRYHKELTCAENLMGVCSGCHESGVWNNHWFRVKFWYIQCERYGEAHMREWLEDLPLKIKPNF